MFWFTPSVYLLVLLSISFLLVCVASMNYPPCSSLSPTICDHCLLFLYIILSVISVMSPVNLFLLSPSYLFSSAWLSTLCQLLQLSVDQLCVTTHQHGLNSTSIALIPFLVIIILSSVYRFLRDPALFIIFVSILLLRLVPLIVFSFMYSISLTILPTSKQLTPNYVHSSSHTTKIVSN